MKIACNREQLLAAFNVAATVAPSRSPKPILQNVKLEVGPDGAVLMATDMEVGVRLDVAGVEVQTPGKVLFPVARFGLILRESNDEKLTITGDSNQTTVRGERSEFKLPATNPDEFPHVVTFQEEKCHEVPSRLFRELIRRTIFATDTESSRYALGGVLLEFDDKKITAVGTDGRRLAKMEGPAVSLGGHKSGDGMTIVPTRSMQLIERALSDADAEIRVAARGNDILVKSQRSHLHWERESAAGPHSATRCRIRSGLHLGREAGFVQLCARGSRTHRKRRDPIRREQRRASGSRSASGAHRVRGND